MLQLVEGKRVNYRASKLTEVLAESLNGHAVTCMIAALSPADINYGDTLSTLRFADNAKKMPVKVEKKLSPTQQLIQDLRKENEALKKRLGLADGGDAAGSEEANAEAMQLAEEARAEAERIQAEADKLKEELEKARTELQVEEADDVEFQDKIKALQAKLTEANDANSAAEQAEETATEDLKALQEQHDAIEAILAEQKQSYEEKLEASEKQEQQIKQAMADSCLSVREMFGVFGSGEDLSNLCYLVNLIADPGASLVVVLKQDLPVVNKEAGSGLGLQLSGDSIAAGHATFRVTDDAVTIEPEGEAKTFVNGAALIKPRELTHGDRIVFGMEHAFRFVAPGGKPTELIDTPHGPVVQDWDYCVSEIADTQGKTQLVMKGVVAKMASERAVKELEAKVAQYEAELERLRAAKGGKGGPAPSPPAGGTGESAQESAIRIMGRTKDDPLMAEVQDLQGQLAETRQALEVLHSLHGVVEGKQENKLDKLVMEVEKGDQSLTSRIEQAMSQQHNDFEAAVKEREATLQLLRELKESVDAVNVEVRKGCRCGCEVQ